MIVGAHSIINSKKPELDKAFLRDVLGLPNVDAGHGWLIFGLPPSEIAVHPAEESGTHEMFFIVKDIKKFVSEMKKRKIKCGPTQELRWGILTQVTMPGGGKLGFYEARHPRPKAVKASTKKPAKART
jgi:hypothetical protein